MMFLKEPQNMELNGVSPCLLKEICDLENVMRGLIFMVSIIGTMSALQSFAGAKIDLRDTKASLIP
jgi:hypothetical protein